MLGTYPVWILPQRHPPALRGPLPSPDSPISPRGWHADTGFSDYGALSTLAVPSWAHLAAQCPSGCKEPPLHLCPTPTLTLPSRAVRICPGGSWQGDGVLGGIGSWWQGERSGGGSAATAEHLSPAKREKRPGSTFITIWDDGQKFFPEQIYFDAQLPFDLYWARCWEAGV